nr:hypothetical protein CFP56_71695 [Quercus suber]
MVEIGITNMAVLACSPRNRYGQDEMHSDQAEARGSEKQIQLRYRTHSIHRARLSSSTLKLRSTVAASCNAASRLMLSTTTDVYLPSKTETAILVRPIDLGINELLRPVMVRHQPEYDWYDNPAFRMISRQATADSTKEQAYLSVDFDTWLSKS